MYESLIKRLCVCVQGTDCTNCPMRYEEEVDGPFLVSVKCSALEAADALEELNLIAESNERSAARRAETAGLAVEQIPRWIPVTERLPEEQQDGFSEDVLMLVENPDGDITWKDVYVGYYLYDETSAETGWWAMMTCDCVKIGEHKYGDKVFPANEYVTHWMPLPEPPKEALSGTKE